MILVLKPGESSDLTKRFRVRCDFCGVEHRVEVKISDNIMEFIFDNHSAIVYPEADDLIQKLNQVDNEHISQAESVEQEARAVDREDCSDS